MATEQKKPRQRQMRTDGDVTRTNIIETAGRLFAERGYDGTTSKSICEQANVNMAAINYHFGSRDGLYLAILQHVHRNALDIEHLNSLASSPLPAEEKLRLFFDKFLGRIMNGCQNWELRVWAREILSPSPLLKRFLAEEVKPKLKVVGGIVGQITGLPPGHPQIPQLVFTLMAPCLLMLVIDKDTPTAFQPLFKIPPESLANHFSSFAKAGLDAVAQHYKD